MTRLCFYFDFAYSHARYHLEIEGSFKFVCRRSRKCRKFECRWTKDMGIFYERHDVYHHVYHTLAFLSCLWCFSLHPCIPKYSLGCWSWEGEHVVQVQNKNKNCPFLFSNIFRFLKESCSFYLDNAAKTCWNRRFRASKIDEYSSPPTIRRLVIRNLVNIPYSCSFSIWTPCFKVSLQALIQSGVHNISWKTPYSSKQTRWGLTKKGNLTFVREQMFEISQFFRRPT